MQRANRRDAVQWRRIQRLEQGAHRQQGRRCARHLTYQLQGAAVGVGHQGRRLHAGGGDVPRPRQLRSSADRQEFEARENRVAHQHRSALTKAPKAC